MGANRGSERHKLDGSLQKLVFRGVTQGLEILLNGYDILWPRCVRPSWTPFLPTLTVDKSPNKHSKHILPKLNGNQALFGVSCLLILEEERMAFLVQIGRNTVDGDWIAKTLAARASGKEMFVSLVGGCLFGIWGQRWVGEATSPGERKIYAVGNTQYNAHLSLSHWHPEILCVCHGWLRPIVAVLCRQGVKVTSSLPIPIPS